MEKETKILIADENAEIRLRTRDVLTAKGAFVDEAKNGDDASRMLARQTYDIVIADLWLSGVDGIGLIKKAAEVSKRAPSFIILTQVGTPSVLMEANRSGAALCLQKPVDYDSLCP